MSWICIYDQNKLCMYELNKFWTCHGYKNKSCLNVQYNKKEKNGYISLNIVIS